MADSSQLAAIKDTADLWLTKAGAGSFGLSVGYKETLSTDARRVQGLHLAEDRPPRVMEPRLCPSGCAVSVKWVTRKGAKPARRPGWDRVGSQRHEWIPSHSVLFAGPHYPSS